ncbi:MAG: GIY-YIG nuclease family protein [Candidatus Levybacteria bacterium]|nr:GIY-YIG nuclease family protein [Candidatus Levybacteria bacterium]
MYYTYVLLCTDTKRNKSEFYTGFTKNLEIRIVDHKTKSVETTKIYDKIELVYYEVCFNEKDARIRENQLKTGFGRGYIKRRLVNYLNIKLRG